MENQVNDVVKEEDEEEEEEEEEEDEEGDDNLDIDGVRSSYCIYCTKSQQDFFIVRAFTLKLSFYLVQCNFCSV